MSQVEQRLLNVYRLKQMPQPLPVGSYIACPKTESIGYHSADNSRAHSRLEKKSIRCHIWVYNVDTFFPYKKTSEQSLPEVRDIY